MKKIFIIIMILSLITSCSKKDEDDDSFSDNEVEAVESVLGSISGSLNDQEQLSSYSLNKVKTPLIRLFLESANAGNQCDKSRFSPKPNSGSTCVGTELDQTILINYQGCSPGTYGKISLNGQVQLTFDSNQTCEDWLNGNQLPTSGSVVRTTSDYSRTSNRLNVSVSSEYKENYLEMLTGGGIKTTFTSFGRDIEILGIHRVGTFTSKRNNVNKIFDHTITTTSSLSVSGSKILGTRTINSGSIKVDHNLSKYSLETTFSNLKYSSNCCYPTEGTLTFLRTGSKTGNMSVEFLSCGEVKITTEDQSLTKSLSSCE